MHHNKGKPAKLTEMEARELKRLEDARKCAVAVQHVKLDGDTQRVYFIGRGKLDLAETMMSMTLPEAASLGATLLQLAFPGQVAVVPMPGASGVPNGH